MPYIRLLWTDDENVMRFIQLYYHYIAIQSNQSASGVHIYISPVNDMGKLRFGVLTEIHFKCTLTLM